MHFIFKKIQSSYSRTFHPVLFLFLCVASLSSYAQERKKVEIIQAGSFKQSKNIANARRLIGDVIIKHKEILMYCDSAYTYENSNRIDAFGRVHINQGDTLHLYAKKIFYDGDKSFAQAINDVQLKNKEATLFTDTLDYDLEQNIAYYNCSGKIIDSTNALTSQVGKYNLNTDMVHFTDSVRGYNGSYTLYSDDIQYNTVSEIIYFGGPTTIKDSLNSLYSEDGWYNTTTGETNLTLNPRVFNATQLLQANYIGYTKTKGDGIATGSVHFEDYEKRTIIEGNKVTFNETSEIATATDSAVFIVYNNTDSLYLHADTLRTVPDSIEGENLVMAYYGVRFFRTDLQGVCDSLIYFSKDSLVQLHGKPVLWSDVHQLSADYIDLRQHSTGPNELHMKQNSFIISEQESDRFDQIKGKEMVGYVVNGKLKNVNVNGNGQTLYYARDKAATIGLNNAQSSKIFISFNDGKIHKIAFKKQPEGTLIPLANLTEKDKKLSGFDWKAELRPLSKDDIFRKDEQSPAAENNKREIKTETHNVPEHKENPKDKKENHKPNLD